MNILVTGRGGHSGSWAVRGEQLGKAIGAAVLPNAIDVAAFDVAVVVKRTPVELVARIHRAGVPLVYDVVDGWPQPAGNSWERDECMTWLRGQIEAVKPAAIVAATQAMADDCAEFGVPVLALPHHARPGLVPSALRPVRVIGYEGSAEHLGSWAAWLEAECQARGMDFRINPNMVEVDVLVALRERTGYAPRNWKSGVKLANAQALGVPIICATEWGYIENASGAEFWADTPDEVRAHLDVLVSLNASAAVRQVMLRAAPMLETLATRYLKWLHRLVDSSPQREN